MPIVKEKRNVLASLPKVDVFLSRSDMSALADSYSPLLVKDALQKVLATIREDVLNKKITDVPADEEVAALVSKQIKAREAFRLRRVINATGTVLHTNLGRSVLSESVCLHVAAVAGYYSNLEYDIAQGQRGSRYSHLTDMLRELTGAEDVLVVNNNAAAVMLALNTLIKGKEVVISRGELVEIGGKFRIPQVIEHSGGHICEVGTTNKTHLSDYAGAIGEETGALMKVHTSNYHIVGFTESVPMEEMSKLAHDHGLPLINDLGSGLLIDMTRFGLPYEPTVKEAIAKGCDIVTFSGDKLLGGPQAGIIVGKKEYIEAMKKNQLLRALRVDKMTIAALEATFRSYLDEERAIRDIPVLQMLALTKDEAQEKCGRFIRVLEEENLPVRWKVEEVTDMVGGGSYPEYNMPGYAVALDIDGITAAEAEKRLREADIPVIVRVQHDRVLISVRTVQEDEFIIICRTLASACK